MQMRKRVVNIVDDDPSVRGALWRLMTAHGYDAHTFGSAQALLASGLPSDDSCILMDFAMPEMNGLELKAELDRLGCTAPAILITAFNDADLEMRARAAGVTALFLKPVDADVLTGAINRAMAETGRRVPAGAGSAAGKKGEASPALRCETSA